MPEPSLLRVKCGAKHWNSTSLNPGPSIDLHWAPRDIVCPIAMHPWMSHGTRYHTQPSRLLCSPGLEALLRYRIQPTLEHYWPHHSSHYLGETRHSQFVFWLINLGFGEERLMVLLQTPLILFLLHCLPKEEGNPPFSKLKNKSHPPFLCLFFF